MAKGFGNSTRKNKLDSRDIFFKEEKLENNFKPAVITPYYKEDLGIIERCHKSCLAQTHKVNHLLSQMAAQIMPLIAGIQIILFFLTLTMIMGILQEE